MEFIEKYPIKNLSSAEYNPRKIEEQNFESLKQSLSKFGVVKPIILNGANKVLTAGHQRTKAMKAIGLEYSPAIILEQISLKDEIKFNLFHNSIETSKSKVSIKNIAKYPLGFSFVDAEDVEVIEKDNFSIVREIARLITQYGEWGSVVVDEDGTVIQNSDYASALDSFKCPLLIYKMESNKVEEFMKYLSLDYGSYYYEALGIKSYNQMFCQMHRLETNGKQKKSTLYENYIIPKLEKNKRLVDFGAGQCEYVRMFKSEGYKAHCYEPHYRTKGKQSIDIKQVVTYIKELEFDIKRNGLYDIVVLDSVLNSITSSAFENYVIATCNALCNEDAIFYTATRSIGNVEHKLNYSKVAENSKRLIEFLDKDNFTATFRNGIWTLQKFYSVENLTELLSKYFDEVEVIDEPPYTLYAICKKPKKLSLEQYKEALNIEFNMEYPNNFKHNKQGELIEQILKRKGV